MPYTRKVDVNISLERYNHDDHIEPLTYPLSDEVVHWLTTKNTKTKQPQEGNNMSNKTRSIVNVILIDEDANLPVEKALVAKYKNIITEDTTTVVIQQIMIDEDVKGAIDKHNKVRTETVNQEVLENTGNEVMLRPVTIKDLTWKVS